MNNELVVYKEEYETMVAKMPKNIKWEDLSWYEQDDNTIGMQSLACSADNCEVVDIS